MRGGDRARPVAGERVPPRPTEHDPDVDPAARHRRDADVAVAQDAHPGVAVGPRRRVAVGEVVGQAEPRREPGRAGDAGRTRDDRMRPVRPDDDRGLQRDASGRPDRGPRAAERRGRRRRRSSPAGRRPRRSARGRAAPGRASSGRTRPPARRRIRCRRSGGTSSRAGVSTRIAGIGRATAASVASSSPARRRAATAAGDAKTPPARQCHAGDRSRTTTSRPGRASRAARTAPAGPPPTIATSIRSSVTRRRPAGRAASPDRARAGVGTAAIA